MGDNSVFTLDIKNVSLTQIFEFELKSDPEWFKDKGSGFISVQNFDITMIIIPKYVSNKIEFEFRDADISVSDI